MINQLFIGMKSWLRKMDWFDRFIAQFCIYSYQFFIVVYFITFDDRVYVSIYIMIRIIDEVFNMKLEDMLLFKKRRCIVCFLFEKKCFQ